ncbi:MAG: hypothetical protein A4E53_01379 [Pelotomaculum sp. PtaB.Bin104]|nr:MAG: hypothetical protein A4E53_01379 [Pelotomaculum sp. PtaB.Bin104]
MEIKLISPKMTLRPMDSEFKMVMSSSIALLILAALTPNDHQGGNFPPRQVKASVVQGHPAKILFSHISKFYDMFGHD